MAEFHQPAELLAAVRHAYTEGYRRMDAYTPFPIHGLADALGRRRSPMPLIVLAGGIIGCLGGYYLQYYTSVHSYPLNVGGRPLHSWPAFIPITFEMTVLTAGLFAVVGMLTINGLPMPYHPVFNVPAFALASRDRFFLCIEATDPMFDESRTAEFLRGLTSYGVYEVPK